MPSFEAMTAQVQPILPNASVTDPTKETSPAVDLEQPQEQQEKQEQQEMMPRKFGQQEQPSDEFPQLELNAPFDTIDSKTEPLPAAQPLGSQAMSSPEEERQPNTELVSLLENQITLLKQMDKRIEHLEGRIESLNNSPELIRLAQVIDTLTDAASKQEKANVAVLRDSKNYQTGVRENIQRELDSYRKMNSDTYLAPLLTDIAQLYITVRQIVSHIQDDKTKEDLNDLVLDTIMEILEDRGVQMQETIVGGNRSLRLCKTRKLVPTGNRDLEGKVARSLNPSFSLGNLVMIKEEIDTYIYDSTLDESIASTGESNSKESGEAISTQPANDNCECPEPKESESSTQESFPKENL